MTVNDPYYKWMKSLEYDYVKFDRNDPERNFVPVHYPPKEDGLYVTIRCGLAGISSNLNEWKNGEWQVHCLDGSKVIAYSREKIKFPGDKSE